MQSPHRSYTPYLLSLSIDTSLYSPVFTVLMYNSSCFRLCSNPLVKVPRDPEKKAAMMDERDVDPSSSRSPPQEFSAWGESGED
mmetsp:Transcript_9315/g.16850  ORF Transcript_9315/g.16850 Transcript_9315/m.16850 type:complete len:84 (+) Transcript_9315:185-436(+)